MFRGTQCPNLGICDPTEFTNIIGNYFLQHMEHNVALQFPGVLPLCLSATCLRFLKTLSWWKAPFLSLIRHHCFLHDVNLKPEKHAPPASSNKLKKNNFLQQTEPTIALRCPGWPPLHLCEFMSFNNLPSVSQNLIVMEAIFLVYVSYMT